MGILGQLVDRGLGLPRTGRTALVVQRDVLIPMSDGVDLSADWYRPRDVTGPLPVVLVRSPYGRRGMFGALFGAAIARQGFQVVVQSVRGTFGSGGELHAYHQEQQDGLDTIAWLRARSWCDGRVAIEHTMKLCATFDHRVLDGAHAAAMAKTLRAWIEEPVAHFERIAQASAGRAMPA